MYKKLHSWILLGVMAALALFFAVQWIVNGDDHRPEYKNANFISSEFDLGDLMDMVGS